ncbi:hypothetical protein JNW91_00715 [Micromonospora sp. STR1_7]|uniref:Uncharacterized protein n=1 Tax=Micromonospora parastrephiae TaxID=2806101 RepID=A0ABS1XMQ1_9ACTN|nr:hypothetical protein [Micromonospora parastrephiae]MBM0230524.1 hypothetical protein [Micromonospora parastrephiae]
MTQASASAWRPWAADRLRQRRGQRGGRGAVVAADKFSIVDEVSSLRSAATAFAEQNALTVVPAVPLHDLGPEVQLDGEVIDLPGFLNLAQRMCAPALYLEVDRFDPDGDSVDDPPRHLLARRGQLQGIEMAFVAGGVVHFWEHIASWYAEWESLLAANHGGLGDEDDDRPRWMSENEREELAEPAVRALLAMAQFRAEKPGGGRYRFAQQHLPADLDERATHTAVRLACERADEMARQRYADIDDHYEQLATDLLADQAYQRAGSAAARKQVAERFLTNWADGWSPPMVAREELYARAQRQAKLAAHRPALY